MPQMVMMMAVWGIFECSHEIKKHITGEANQMLIISEDDQMIDDQSDSLLNADVLT